MNLLTRMMAWWDFEEDVSLGHTVMDKSGRGNHIPMAVRADLPTFVAPPPFGTWAGGQTEQNAATRVDGKVGYGIKTYSLNNSAGSLNVSSNQDLQLSRHPVGVGTTEYTIALWVNVQNCSGSQYLVQKGFWINGEFLLEFFGGATPYFRLTHYNAITLTPHIHVVKQYVAGEFEWNEWHFVIAGVSALAGTGYAFIQVDNTVEIRTNGSISTYYTDQPFSINSNPLGVLGPTQTFFAFDSIGLWKRELTSEEKSFLWNNGSGRQFSDIYVPVAPDEAREVTCACSDDLAYKSDECNTSGAGTGITRDCPKDITLTFDPPPGTHVIFPIYISITSDPTTATIRYTTDGTVPNDSSMIYTGPILVPNAGTTVKAKGFIYGCNEGATFEGTWIPFNFNITFGAHCNQTVDYVGWWAPYGTGFAPDTYNDYQWYLNCSDFFTFEWLWIEIYMLDSNMQWNTGQLWSTKEYITLPNGTLFHAMPLMVFDDNFGVPLNIAYQNDLGSLVGPLDYTMFGQPQFSPPLVNGFWKIKIVQEGQDPIYRTVSVNDCLPPVTPPPTPCPPVETPVISQTANCGELLITFTVNAAFNGWRIYRRTASPVTGDWALLTSAVGVGAISFTDSTVTTGTEYQYYVSCEMTDVTYTACGTIPAWIDGGISAQAKPICGPEVLLFQLSPSQITNVGTVTITYSTQCVGSAAGDLELWRKAGLGPWVKIADGSTVPPTVKNLSGQTYVDTPGDNCPGIADNQVEIFYQINVKKTGCPSYSESSSVIQNCPLVCLPCASLTLLNSYKVLRTSDNPPSGTFGWDQFVLPMNDVGTPQTYCCSSSVIPIDWDGLLTLLMPCFWWKDESCRASTQSGRVIRLKQGSCSLEDPNIYCRGITLVYSYTLCRWELDFASIGFNEFDCCTTSATTKRIWFGIKIGGNTPIGKYIVDPSLVFDPNQSITSLWVANV